MNRRKFLSLSALFAAPAIIKAEPLMKVYTPPLLSSVDVFELDRPGGTIVLYDCIETYGTDHGEDHRKECERLMRIRRRELLRDMRRATA